jgi:hypothetical protein
MLKLANDNVITLLASLGFDDSFLGARAEIVIDSFDQWTNPEFATARATTACACGVHLDESVGAAA